MFEGQSQFRKAQNMAALLGIVILIGVILPIPIGAGFADWMNSVNAPVEIDQRYTETENFDWDDKGLESSAGYKPYFYWYNGSGNTNKHNVSLETGGGGRKELTADTASKDLAVYLMNDTTFWDSLGDDAPDWEEGIPYWEVYFNYTAKDAYDDGVVRIGLNLDSSDSWLSAADESASPCNRSNVDDGDGLLSYEDPSDDAEDVRTVTVTLSAGGVEFLTKSLSYNDDSDGQIETNFTIDVNDLREAIMSGGHTAYFKLKVRGHDIRPIDMSGSSFQTYNVNRLFGRDDGLYLVSMISVICAAMGIFLVQPRYSLPIGNTGGSTTRKRRGY